MRKAKAMFKKKLDELTEEPAPAKVAPVSRSPAVTCKVCAEVREEVQVLKDKLVRKNKILAEKVAQINTLQKENSTLKSEMNILSNHCKELEEESVGDGIYRLVRKSGKHLISNDTSKVLFTYIAIV